MASKIRTATPALPEARPGHEHLANASSLALRETRALAADVQGINRKTAIVVPAILGSMPFFWFAVVLSLCSLPAVLAAFDTEVLKSAIGLSGFFPKVIIKVSLIALVAWVAQTFIQLVALPVLQVSNNAQMASAEEHTAVILDRLDTDTAGGITTLLSAIDELRSLVIKQETEQLGGRKPRA
jgi:hypothetical protein